MKLINSHERLVTINKRKCWIYIDEYPTIWICYAKQLGHALCFADNWRYKKKDAKSLNDIIKVLTDDLKDRI